MLIGHTDYPDARALVPAAYGWRSPDRITQVIIHHSVTSWHGDDETVIRQVHDIHLGNGWPGISYHALVMPTGTAYVTGDIATWRYHSSGMNNVTGYAVCLVGNYEHRDPPEAQATAARRFARDVMVELGRAMPVNGHRDLLATACPGNWWGHWGRDYFNSEEPEMDKERIKRLLHSAWGIALLLDQLKSPYGQELRDVVTGVKEETGT